MIHGDRKRKRSATGVEDGAETVDAAEEAESRVRKDLDEENEREKKEKEKKEQKKEETASSTHNFAKIAETATELRTPWKNDPDCDGGKSKAKEFDLISKTRWTMAE